MTIKKWMKLYQLLWQPYFLAVNVAKLTLTRVQVKFVCHIIMQLFKIVEMDIFISQENEHSISDLEDDLILSDQLSYSADKKGTSNKVV